MPDPIHTTVVIAGGGPAGMMAGLLLARAGIEVAVLEKHYDFLRDFRGDTIHPSTLQVMHELGLLDLLLARPHDRVETLALQFGRTRIPMADLRHLPTRCKYIALMPQWEFLDFLASAAHEYEGFHLHMKAEATGLIEEGGRIVGLRAGTPQGPTEFRAALTIAADGRHSTLRRAAGFAVEHIGAPMDVLWMRLSRHPTDDPQTMGIIDRGRMLVMLNRTTYWQCAYVIPKGTIDSIRAAGIEAFRQGLAHLAPMLADRTAELAGWDDVKLLTVAIDRLPVWHRPGLLCIGDAAHAMSPVGGVGINLAVQDAIATANLLAPALISGTAPDLAAVQSRRGFPTIMTQRMQVMMQNRLVSPALAGTDTAHPPFALRLMRHIPFLPRLLARLLALGFRPEHVHSPHVQGPAA
jgi:2-polyprenyl-6-methoxyphenol hydroxylase-like FAD-dependent oxidoreductase